MRLILQFHTHEFHIHLHNFMWSLPVEDPQHNQLHPSNEWKPSQPWSARCWRRWVNPMVSYPMAYSLKINGWNLKVSPMEKAKINLNERKLILERPIFHFHDYGRRVIRGFLRKWTAGTWKSTPWQSEHHLNQTCIIVLHVHFQRCIQPLVFLLACVLTSPFGFLGLLPGWCIYSI